MRTADFHYDLPPELIAQQPAPARDDSRLLVWSRAGDQLEHRRFADLLEHLRPGDLLVLNDSRVLPARLRARKDATGGQVEVFLVAENQRNDWWAMLRPAKRVRPGTLLQFLDRAGEPSPVSATVLAKNPAGHCRLGFTGVPELRDVLERLGETPLPPYVERPAGPSAADAERYQTVYAAAPGSVAAPTAGLHFTDALLRRARSAGVEVCRVTLHVGPGTFAPVKASQVEQHRMAEEAFVVPTASAAAITAARREGRRVIAVGSTSLRVLESVALEHRGEVVAGQGRTRLFVHPPFNFQVVSALLTNFHLPQSTLLMLVSAFAAPGRAEGRARALAVYAEAVCQRYRFYSFGDAMLML